MKTLDTRCNKLVEQQNVADSTDVDVVGVSETWLNDTLLDTEILNSDYIVYRRDRVGKRGGGILLAVKNRYKSSLVESLSNHEIMAVTVQSVNTKVLLILRYRPPRADVNDFVIALRNVLLNVHSMFSNVCIIGDFKFLDLSWEESNYNSYCTSVNEHVFLKCIDDLNLVQLNKVLSNVHGHILDLILTNNPHMCSDVSKCDIDFTSDHEVFCLISIKYKRNL